MFGAGGVGLSAVMAAFASGVGTIIAVDPVANRRQLAAELGASADARSRRPATSSTRSAG